MTETHFLTNSGTSNWSTQASSCRVVQNTGSFLMMPTLCRRFSVLLAASLSSSSKRAGLGAAPWSWMVCSTLGSV